MLPVAAVLAENRAVVCARIPLLGSSLAAGGHVPKEAEDAFRVPFAEEVSVPFSCEGWVANEFSRWLRFR